MTRQFLLGRFLHHLNARQITVARPEHVAAPRLGNPVPAETSLYRSEGPILMGIGAGLCPDVRETLTLQLALVSLPVSAAIQRYGVHFGRPQEGRRICALCDRRGTTDPGVKTECIVIPQRGGFSDLRARPLKWHRSRNRAVLHCVSGRDAPCQSKSEDRGRQRHRSGRWPVILRRAQELRRWRS